MEWNNTKQENRKRKWPNNFYFFPFFSPFVCDWKGKTIKVFNDFIDTISELRSKTFIDIFKK